MDDEVTVAVTRAEWVSFGALALNIATLVFGLGVIWADVQDHERRIGMVETDNKALVEKVARIDENVAFLAERAREDRQRGPNR
jgi:cell division protein FtsB